MGKKRKSVASSLDEVDRTMYTTFCSAASSLSQLYTQAMNQQKLSFQAGERHGLEKVYQWILRQEESGSRVSTIDIVTYLQDELDFSGEEPSMSPRVPIQHQHSQPAMQIMNTGFVISSGSSGLMTAGQGTRSEQFEHQSRNSVFSNALSSPVRRSLQHYNIGRSGYNVNTGPLYGGNGPRNSEPNQIRDVNPLSSNDSSMDMHADSPAHESPH